MPAQLIDLSHHNAAPNWAALRAGGTAGVVLKATEGTSFADPVFAPWRAAAHAAGLAVGAYHFTRLGDPKAEAAWFAKTVGGLQPGEFACLDLEVSVAGVDPVAWVGQWLDALHALGVPVRLLYLNQSELAGHDWAPIVARGVLLWLADYDHNPATPGPHGAWPAVTLKQYTDAGTVPGETGPVDVDVLFGALTQLTGQPAPVTATAVPVPEEDPVLIECDYAKDPTGKVTDHRFGLYSGGVLIGLGGAERPGFDQAITKGATVLWVESVTWDLMDRRGQQLVGDAVSPALVKALAALPAAQASMVCQGNPHAVLTALGQAATTAAAAT